MTTATTTHNGITYTATIIDDNRVWIDCDECVPHELIGEGTWDGARIECSAVLGHHQDASDDIYLALERGLRSAAAKAQE